MDLGWLDVCLCVTDARRSVAFYHGLGFRMVEGNENEGWAVVVNGDARLGLFERRHMGDDWISLNFRGGNVPELAESLIRKGYGVEANGPSARLRDPDGHLIFLDAAPGEAKKV